jgi:hypothetical protein
MRTSGGIKRERGAAQRSKKRPLCRSVREQGVSGGRTDRPRLLAAIVYTLRVYGCTRA